jgi:hypothetical protein
MTTDRVVLELGRRLSGRSWFQLLGCALWLVWLLAQSSAYAGDVSFFSIEKGIEYLQSDPGSPALEVPKGFFFEANVKASGSNLVSGASVQTPDGTVRSLGIQMPGQSFRLKKSFDTQPALDAVYGSGAYALLINTVHDGLKTISLLLRGDVYPPAPHLKNFQVAQSIDTNANFVLLWDPFIGGTTGDFIHVRIEDESGSKLFESADFGKRGALNGTNAQVALPSFILGPGQRYQATLSFQRITALDKTSYSPALGIAVYDATTHFQIATLAANDAPTFSPGQLLANGQFHFHLQGVSGQTYRIDASNDLRQWDSIAQNTIIGSEWDFYDSESTNLSQRFYRAALVQ